MIEVSSPAEHETWVEHEIDLPTGKVDPARDFAGQRFVRHSGRQAKWTSAGSNSYVAETAIEDATNGLLAVRFLKSEADGTAVVELGADFVFIYVLSGLVHLESKSQTLHTDDHLVITDRAACRLTALQPSMLLEVRLREI